MKGKPVRRPGRMPSGTAAAEEIAVRAFGALASDSERLGRFLALSGLDPARIRHAATEPGFLPAVMDHLLGDEELLTTVARELDLEPEALARAGAVLSPMAGDDP